MTFRMEQGMSPQRIQRKRTAGWRMPEGAVYVGRGSRWGNPFKVGGLCRTPGPWKSPAAPYDGVIGMGEYEGRDIKGERYTYVVREVHDRADAVALFEMYIGYYDDQWPVEAIREELAGKTLACWCPIDQPCHADVLLRLANA